MDDDLRTLRFTVSGRRFEVAARRGARLYWVLVEALDEPLPRGCGVGDCGTCHMLLDGRSVPICILPADAADGGVLEFLAPPP